MSAPAAAPEKAPDAPSAPETPGTRELAALLERIAQDTAAQKRYARQRLGLARLCAGMCGLLTAAALGVGATLLPRVNATLDQARAATANLEAVSGELAQADLAGIAQNADETITKAGAGVDTALVELQAALQTVEEVDVETLNRAITDLQTAVAPLARMFGGKG